MGLRFQTQKKTAALQEELLPGWHQTLLSGDVCMIKKYALLVCIDASLYDFVYKKKVIK